MKQIVATHWMRLVSHDNYHPRVWKPPMDVYRTQTGWLLKFELAGVRLADTSLELTRNTVRLTGTRRDSVCHRSCAHQAMEIAYSSFERSVELPSDLSHARFRSDISEGMLLVQIELS